MVRQVLSPEEAARVRRILMGEESSEEEDLESDEEEDLGSDEEEVQPPVPVIPVVIPCGGSCGKSHAPENIIRCEAGHPLCLDDAQSYTGTQLGNVPPVLALKCPNSTCDKILPGSEVLRFIDLNIFKGKPKELLEKMIERVGVKDMVKLCPVCNKVVVCGPVTDPQNNVIICTEPACKRISCRKCRRLKHDIEDCAEAIKQSLECHHCQKVYPPSEIVRCEVGHPVCIPAAKDYLQRQLGSDIPVLNCLHPLCDKIYTGTEVFRFLDPIILKGIPRTRLEIIMDEIGVEDLVEICPNCDTVIMCGLLDDDSTFHCTNESCKETYRRVVTTYEEESDFSKPDGDNTTSSFFSYTPEQEDIIENATTGEETYLRVVTTYEGESPFSKTDEDNTNSSFLSYTPEQEDNEEPFSKTDEDNTNSSFFSYTAEQEDIRIKIENAITESMNRAQVALQFEFILDAALFKICKTQYCGTKLLKQNGHNILPCSRCNYKQCYICGNNGINKSHYLATGRCDGLEYS